MKRAWVIVIGAALALAGCGPNVERSVLHGYGEGDYIYLSSQDGGVIGEVLVKEGDQVAPGDVLFRLDPERTNYAAQSVSAEHSALAEAVRAARADAQLAQTNLQRGQELFDRGFYPRARLDADVAANSAAQARLAQAQRALNAAGAEQSLAAERVQDLEVAAPTAGVVQRIFHRAGEVVPPGQPIISVLAPENMKVRFFAPQDMLARFQVGTIVDIACDGCAAGLQARVSFAADEPQFTPPVIYSLEERDKLVFLIEARPLQPARIPPGAPVEITPPAAAP